MNRTYPGSSGHCDAGLVHWLNVCSRSPRSYHAHSLFHQEEPRWKVPRWDTHFLRQVTCNYYALYIIYVANIFFVCLFFISAGQEGLCTGAIG